jgi:protein tyrosine/serine phosphatase
MTRVTPDLTTERALAWEGCLNARDLGGLTTVDGRRTRPAALIRSDTLCRLSPVGRAALIAHGVRTVVDVRFPSEIEREDPAHPFRDGPDGVLYLNRPTNVGHTAEEDAAMVAGIRAAESRLELNLIDLDANRAGFASIATAIARAPAGGVVVHCHAGKDRTGIAIALVLSLVGVPDETIASDYALSGGNLDGLTREWLDGISQDPAVRGRLMRQADPVPEAMLALLKHLRRQHGGAEAYLVAGGAAPTDLAALRVRLLDC